MFIQGAFYVYRPDALLDARSFVCVWHENRWKTFPLCINPYVVGFVFLFLLACVCPEYIPCKAHT